MAATAIIATQLPVIPRKICCMRGPQTGKYCPGCRLAPVKRQRLSKIQNRRGYKS